MLHEVLLTLSGHSSRLFLSQDNLEASSTQSSISCLPSPSESALLPSIAALSTLHRRLRSHLAHIATTHSSIICSAVALSIHRVHLARFQQHILDVERKILTRDASTVGAYDIVPLAGIVAEFDVWGRRMEWYWETACFMLAPDDKGGGEECTGPGLIDKLREDAMTGFPDVEAAAVELSRVAEAAWLRGLAGWVGWGRVPIYGGKDFFIQLDSSQGADGDTFAIQEDLRPKFLTKATATSIFFIGKSLNQTRRLHSSAAATTTTTPAPLSEADLANVHLTHLSSLALSLVPADLTRAVASIRTALSQNVLQHILPLPRTLLLLSSLRELFLLGRSEFALSLIACAEEKLKARHQGMGRLLASDEPALKGLTIQPAEMQQTLAETFRLLSRTDESEEDEVLAFARKHMSLIPRTTSTSHTATARAASFNDLLFPTPSTLTLTLPSPLNLLITPADIEIYAHMNAYLLSLRRAQSRLADLWRPPRRRTADKRYRKIWATCSAALFLISETSAYLEGEVVQGSYDVFETWVRKGEGEKDPETLASAHREFLSALRVAMLLEDARYTRELRALLGDIDALVAGFTRARAEEWGERGEGVRGGEEALELDRARKRVDSGVKSVINKLRAMDAERVGVGEGRINSEEAGFEAWRGNAVERLLGKVEIGRVE